MPAGFHLSIIASGLILLAGQAGAAVTLGQSDNFESGLQGWTSGLNNPNGPAIDNSAGTEDNFLRLSASGLSSSGGRLVAFNSGQWAGNYLAAGVDAIRMQVNNLGATDLALRLIFESATLGQNLGTLSPVNVAAGSGWNTVSFSLAAANLGGGDYAGVLGDVSALTLLHSPDFTIFRTDTPFIAAQLGVDNIAAVPEPTTLLLSAVGLALVAGRARAKQQQR